MITVKFESRIEWLILIDGIDYIYIYTSLKSMVSLGIDLSSWPLRGDPFMMTLSWWPFRDDPFMKGNRLMTNLINYYRNWLLILISS